MQQDDIKEFEESGLISVAGAFDTALMAEVGACLDSTIQDYVLIHQRLGYTGAGEGGAHHVLARGGVFLEVLQDLEPYHFLQTCLGGKAIINSFGGVKNERQRVLYSHNVHRDIRFFRPGPPLMLNLLIMLDDFTADNGATWLMRSSHRMADKPSDQLFKATAQQALGRRGDMVIFDSRLWHAAGENRVGEARRALTLTVTNPFFKPQFDYCRALGDETCRSLSDKQQQLLGWYARVPASLEDWYQPVESRFYRGDQDRATEQ